MGTQLLKAGLIVNISGQGIYVYNVIILVSVVPHDNKGDAEFYGSPNSLYQFGAMKERYGYYTYESRSNYHCAINVCSVCGGEIKEEQQPSPPGMKPGQPSLLAHVTISLLRRVIITQSKEKLYSSVINTQPCMQLRCENIHNNYMNCSVMQYE